MRKSRIFEQRSTPVIDEYDVIVCGGGISGVAAAVAAKRMGSRVLLLEKSVMLGGLATNGLISFYEPLCDGNGNKLIYGISDELLHLSMKYSMDTLPDCWRDDPDYAQTSGRSTRYETHYSPAIYTMALDEYVLSEKVDLLFDTTVVDVVCEGGKFIGVTVENKSGRSAYLGKTIIDTTGDSDVLYRAGVPCVCDKNYIVYTSFPTTLKDCEDAVKTKNIMNSRKWINVGADYYGNAQPEGMPLFEGVSAEIVTDFVITGRNMLLNKIKDIPKNERDVAVIPGMPQLRRTRRIVGEFTLKEEDACQHFEDSIGSGADFINPGYPFEVPYGVLYNKLFGNIFTAGRSASSDGWGWELLRCIPVAAVTGQAAGTAASLCAKKNCSADELPIKELQDALTNAGVRIHYSDDIPICTTGDKIQNDPYRETL